jgi:hypothetical protein
MGMNLKKFTQAYFLIKNNHNYAHSLGDRAQAIIFWACLSCVFFGTRIKMRLYANDKI